MDFTKKWKQLWKYDNWRLVNVAPQQQMTDRTHWLTVITNESIGTPVVGHTYYNRIEIKNSENVNSLEYQYGYFNYYGNSGVHERVYVANHTGNNITIHGFNGHTQNEMLSLAYRAFCIDLTEMFGEGNEPSTVEQFKAAYPDIERRSPFEPHQIGSTNA